MWYNIMVLVMIYEITWDRKIYFEINELFFYTYRICEIINIYRFIGVKLGDDTEKIGKGENDMDIIRIGMALPYVRDGSLFGRRQ